MNQVLKAKYRVDGMDCASCTVNIGKARAGRVAPRTLPSVIIPAKLIERAYV